MKHLLCLIAGPVAVWCLLAAPRAAASQKPLPQADSWATECVELRDGRKYFGLVESEDDDWLYLTEIRRPNGRPMFLVIRPIDRASIENVVRLQPDQRANLHKQIRRFKHRARIEAARMDALRLSTTQSDGKPHRHYRGKWFSLESTADGPTTRRVIVRVEQVFTAYRQILAPRTQAQRTQARRTQARRTLRILVLDSLDEYRRRLQGFNLAIENRAIFVQRENLVVAGSSLARYTAELAKVNDRHDQFRQELHDLEGELKSRLQKLSRQLKKQGKPRSEIATVLLREKRRAQDEINRRRNEIRRCNRLNAQAFDRVTREMFCRLYHEAFHAYLENCVFPSEKHHVPLWLNEGLAMVFETGLLEGGALRVDAPNRPALKRLQDDLKSGRPLPLAELLAAGREQFLVHHNASLELSNRHYYNAWGLVYYLTFKKRLLSDPALDRYVAADARTSDPVRRFEKLVGMPIDQFQQQWCRYILALR